mmetsp:Transcript_11601/g.17431  ORF Transcript_11601/g.17431 Transcript_11601/m.17431 type:complete len:279 (+) Transcript_11601:24-860(+)
MVFTLFFFVEIFEAIKHGDHRPWHFAEVYVNAPWGFNPQYTQPLQDTVDGPAAVEYWYGLLDLWADLCFQFGNVFEVFTTANMGLGVRSKFQSTFEELSLDLLGILEPLSFAKFSHLHRMGYQSLYEFPNDEDELTFAVLFGPLALCNSQAGVQAGFEHSSVTGSDLLCRVTFTFDILVEEFDAEEDILEISQVKYDISVEHSRFIHFTQSFEQFETTDYLYAGYHEMITNTRLDTWFYRCRMSARHHVNVDVSNTYYIPNEEVFIAYPLFTINHNEF